MGWVFVKNDQSLNKSMRKKKKKDLSQSFGTNGAGGSDNTSLDSFAERQSHERPATNFAELLQRHQDLDPNQDAQLLQDHQQQFNIVEDDSPSQILNKVQQQVHDSMCPGNTMIDANITLLS